jgi:cytoskeletal protein RodZ
MSHRDRFDDIPHDVHVVGVHRGPRPRGRGWIVFAWAALATGLLVVVGLVVLNRIDPTFSLPFVPTASPSATTSAPSTPAVTPITDPKDIPAGVNASITVLNGTATENADETLAQKLQGEGWTVSGTANAASRDIATTAVYYSTADLEGVALGLAKEIGTDAVQLSDATTDSPITIVIGADYKG